MFLIKGDNKFMVKNNIQVEICCGSYYDALQAWKGGAKRIELNSALYLGGLTPSLGTLVKVKHTTDLEVICMVRPRGAGFCYNTEDLEVMLEDAFILLENGADGIAFGCLNEEGNIHIKQTEKMLKILKKYNKKAIFHRAFDCVKDVDEAMQTLICLGIDRVLTSGLADKAIDGLEMIRYLQKTYGNQIEILAGSGINEQNVKKIIYKTGIHQIHSSCKAWDMDKTANRGAVNFSYKNSDIEGKYETVNIDLVKKLITSLETL